MTESKRSHPRYRIRPVTTPLPSRGMRNGAKRQDDTTQAAGAGAPDPFIRPEAEDDDGYDPFSDRPPDPEPAFQEDPWR